MTTYEIAEGILAAHDDADSKPPSPEVLQLARAFIALTDASRNAEQSLEYTIGYMGSVDSSDERADLEALRAALAT